MLQHPWQNGPYEIIQYVLKEIKQDSDVNKRIAYLLLDYGVETILKTYLELPNDIIGDKVSYSKRKETVTKGSFHEVIKCVEQSASDLLVGIEMSHFQYFHEIRNKLYHDGNGITITNEQVKSYANKALELMEILLGIQISNEDEISLMEKNSIIEKIYSLRTILKDTFSGLKEDLFQLMEKIEYEFVLPSFEKQYIQWASIANQVIFQYFLLKDKETEGEKESFYFSDNVLAQVLKNVPQFWTLMPKVINKFGRENSLSPSDLFYLMSCHEKLELFFGIISVKFQELSEDDLRVYPRYKIFTGEYHDTIEPMSKKDLEQLHELLREGENINSELTKIHYILKKRLN